MPKKVQHFAKFYIKCGNFGKFGHTGLYVRDPHVVDRVEGSVSLGNPRMGMSLGNPRMEVVILKLETKLSKIKTKCKGIFAN